MKKGDFISVNSVEFIEQELELIKSMTNKCHASVTPTNTKGYIFCAIPYVPHFLLDNKKTKWVINQTYITIWKNEDSEGNIQFSGNVTTSGISRKYRGREWNESTFKNYYHYDTDLSTFIDEIEKAYFEQQESRNKIKVNNI